MTTGVLLRDMIDADLAVFFDQQLDPDANRMAAFIARDPTDRDGFLAHWARIRGDGTIIIKTIMFEGQVARYVLKHEQFGRPELSYWLGTTFWGKGIATRALSIFLSLMRVRPVYAHVATDNVGSRRVLERCGFDVISEGEAEFSNARGELTEQIVLSLHYYGVVRNACQAGRSEDSQASSRLSGNAASPEPRFLLASE
jgi:RimJ/RimL family protein N-acetyltransferase